MIRLISSGKGPVLSGQVKADLYLDCRGIRNPYRDPVLGGLTGDSPVLQDWLWTENHDAIRAMTDLIKIASTTHRSRNSYREGDPLVVCFFCLAGIHRSRGMKHVVGQLLREEGFGVEVVR